MIATSDNRMLEAVQRLDGLIESYRDESERDRNLASPVIAGLREAGLFRSWLPRELGGGEASLLEFLEVVEHISVLDGATGWVFANIAAAGHLAAYLPERGAREVFANPLTLTAGASAPKGRATPVEGGYRVSGQWNLASGCHHADWLSVGALIFDDGTPRFLETGEPDLHFFFFPAADAEILDTWHSMGLRGTGSADLVLSDVFVPRERTIGFFSAKPWSPAPLYRIGILPLFSVALAAVSLGIARASLSSFAELASTKVPAMSMSTLGSRPTVHAEVARAEALLQSARVYFRTVADEMMADVERGGGLSEETEARRRLAGMTVADNCIEVVERMHRIAGASSIYTGSRLERCVRDIHTASQHLFVSPSWWEKTGQYYLGQGLGMP